MNEEIGNNKTRLVKEMPGFIIPPSFCCPSGLEFKHPFTNQINLGVGFNLSRS
jgi:hypothetical protein